MITIRGSDQMLWLFLSSSWLQQFIWIKANRLISLLQDSHLSAPDDCSEETNASSVNSVTVVIATDRQRSRSRRFQWQCPFYPQDPQKGSADDSRPKTWYFDHANNWPAGHHLATAAFSLQESHRALQWYQQNGSVKYAQLWGRQGRKL